MKTNRAAREVRAAYVEALRTAYVEALRTDGQTDLADLLNGLNARTWGIDDAEPGATSPRHVVDVFGLTFDVRRTTSGLVVDLNTEGVDEGDQPIEVNLGDTQLT